MAALSTQFAWKDSATMREFLKSLLPPWNLARIFAYTRTCEERIDRLETEIAELKTERAALNDYILMLRQSPPLSAVRPQQQSGEMKPLPARKSLRGLRNQYTGKAVMQMAREGKIAVDEEMKNRADEFAARNGH